MNSLEDISIYLPKYLSPGSSDKLFEELKRFPDNIDSRLYTDYLQKDRMIYQGDGLTDMLVVNLPNEKIAMAPAMVLSNTCDISPVNPRLFPSAIIYATIFNLEKYKNALLEEGIKDVDSIDSHVRDIRKQRITQIFYLPPHGMLERESIVFFDRINNCDTKYIDFEKLKGIRLFTLSNYGLYLFLFKLSVHFTRILEGIDRDASRA